MQDNRYWILHDGISSLENCPKCGRQKASTGSASLTQWIVACNCDSAPVGDGEPIQIDYCAACGKRTKAGRSGSFTQWIFRQDLCSCVNPLGIRFEEVAQSVATGTVDDTADESEMEVDANEFPIDRYKPLALLGQGSLGRVFLCRDRLLNKQVAVKTIRKSKQTDLVSFQNEARAHSRLSHPNIVKVYDFGIIDGDSPFMVMDFVRGVSLDKVRQRSGYLRWQKVFRIMVELCEALTYAHGNGILHRDVKPSNILIDRFDTANPSVCLIDFGIAQVKSTDSSSSGAHERLAGTPAYMSPDEGGGLEYTERSEIYSIGCIIFECIAGRAPFIGDTALSTLIQHAEREPELLRQVNPDATIPESVQDIVTKCLQKDPNNRYHTVEALKADLLRVLNEDSQHSGIPSASPVVADIGTTSDTKGDRGKTFILASVFLILLIVIPVVVLTYNSKNVLHKVEVPADQQAKQAAGKGVVPDRPISEIFQISYKEGRAVATQYIHDSELKPLIREKIQSLNLGDQPYITDEACKYMAQMPLVTLTILKTNLTDKGFKRVNQCKPLRYLCFGGSKITDNACKNLNPNLINLGVGDNKITDESMKYIGKLKYLDFLVVSTTGVTGEGLQYIRNAPVRMLHLSHCAIGDKGIAHLADIPTLKHLYALDTGIGIEGLRSIRKLPLDSLEIAFNQKIDNACLKFVIETWPHLQILNIDQTSITPQGLKLLRGLDQLTTLKVSRLEIKDKDMEPIYSLSKLKELDISYSMITDESVDKLSQMPSLKLVRMNSCDFVSKEAMKRASKHFTVDSAAMQSFAIESEVQELLDGAATH